MFLWSAGSAVATGHDGVGVNLSKWSASQVVILGFGTQGSPFALADGDLFQITLFGPNSSGSSLFEGVVTG